MDWLEKFMWQMIARQDDWVERGGRMVRGFMKMNWFGGLQGIICQVTPDECSLNEPGLKRITNSVIIGK